MTSIRDVLGDSLAVGERFELRLEERDGRLVADHPNEASPLDIAVVEGTDRLEERPPADPVTVEVLDRTVENYVAGRVVETRE